MTTDLILLVYLLASFGPSNCHPHFFFNYHALNSHHRERERKPVKAKKANQWSFRRLYPSVGTDKIRGLAFFERFHFSSEEELAFSVWLSLL